MGADIYELRVGTRLWLDVGRRRGLEHDFAGDLGVVEKSGIGFARVEFQPASLSGALARAVFVGLRSDFARPSGRNDCGNGPRTAMAVFADGDCHNPVFRVCLDSVSRFNSCGERCVWQFALRRDVACVVPV